ncbi:MAG: DUF2183 domain-containing protein [Bdellovibrionales bacterium]|nr:DUF2183 domain-containing protein [Bdellovibrionales bacterium]
MNKINKYIKHIQINWLFFLVLSSFFSLNAAFGQVLFVSDIDDTLKNTHVLDRSDALFNSFHTDNNFKGLAELYQKLKTNHNEVIFAYVSNAPESIYQEYHEQFIKDNHFPQGQVLLRQSLFEKNHKVKAITDLIKKIKPRFLIFVGDNGEQDISIYASIAKTYPQVNSLTFIHTVYDSKSTERETKGMALMSNQIPFVSSLDLATVFQKYNLISMHDLYLLSKQMTPLLINELNLNRGSLFIPRWVLCPDFYRYFNQHQMSIQPFLYPTYQHIMNRCKP